MAIGTIKKLVRVPCAHEQSHGETPTEGYGIILGEDGQEVFFLDSVVNHVAFCELKRGQEVRYVIEEGPLSRAAVVIPCRQDSALKATKP